MNPKLSPVLSQVDLPLEELQAARLDGEVYMIGEAFAPIDEVEQARHRAHSLRAMMVPRLIAERMSAAWIHGARDRAPASHEFCVSHSARVRVPSPRRFHLREVVLGPGDTETIGGVMVTTPLRTAIDLARGQAFGDAEAEVLRSLLRVHQLSVDECRREIEQRHKLAGKRNALVRIAALEQSAVVSS
jgi:hypothetical protein